MTYLRPAYWRDLPWLMRQRPFPFFRSLLWWLARGLSRVWILVDFDGTRYSHVRIDRAGGLDLLSYSTSPSFRFQGHAATMLCLFKTLRPRTPIYAVTSTTYSRDLLQSYAGFRLVTVLSPFGDALLESD